MSTPDDRIAKAFENHKVWLYEPVKNDRHVITHVKVFLSYDDIPLLDAAAELVPPDPAVVEEYWRQPTPSEIKRGLNWEEMNDPPGFMRPEYAQRKELSEWAWAVLDREALEAEGLAIWRARLEPAPVTPDTPNAAAEVNTASEGPKEYPEADAMADELERLKADNAAKDAELESLRQKLADETPQALPPNPTEAKLSDYGEVGEPGVPGDLAQLMMDDEQLPEAVARLTPSIDELLDMAQVLSDASMERAIASFPEDRFEEWTEKLWAEKARLRTKRGTDEENLSRENLISRVAGLFMRVGAKR